MRIGINLMAWSGVVGPEEIAHLPAIAALGFDGVELPVFDPGRLDAPRVREALAASGLACTASSALPPGASLIRPAEQAAGIAFLRDCLRTVAAVGATVLCGPLFAPVGQLTGVPRTADEWDAAVQGLRQVAPIAEDLGIQIAIEPLNRFETYFLNTARDARRLVEEVDRPAIGLLLDTFHMNIEEARLDQAIRQTGRQIYHFHCSENDRGIVGRGHLPWSAVRQALDETGYTGWLVCETFNGRLPELAAATAIWRPLFPDPLTYARESLRFLQQTFEKDR